MKNSQTWRLTYCKPFFGNFSVKLFPADSRNIITGQDEYLLTNGQVINRPPRMDLGQSAMPMPLVDVVTKYSRHTGQDEKYKSLSFEVVTSKYDGGDPQQAKIMELNKSKLEFMKRSLYVSYKDFSGKELNSNFPTDSMDYYILENIDELEYQKSAHDEKIKTLGFELVQVKKNKTAFEQLCYLFGVNVSQMSFEMAYNILSDVLQKDPDLFAKKMNDPDRWYKIVINKALRTLMPDNQAMYITEEASGSFTNFYQNGKHIATGFDAIIGYYKDNKEIFDALEEDLGLKKSGTPQVTKEERMEMKTVPEPGESQQKMEVLPPPTEPEVPRKRFGRPPVKTA